MVNWRQQYQGLNKKFVVGAIGYALSLSSLIGVIGYDKVKGLGSPVPEPTGNYARVVEIENELSKNLRLEDVNSGLVSRVDGLRTELETLNKSQEVKDARADVQRRAELSGKIFTHIVVPTISLGIVSAFPFGIGLGQRNRKLRELRGE